MKKFAWVLILAASTASPAMVLGQYPVPPRPASVIRQVGFNHGYGHSYGGPACDCGPAPLSCSGNCCHGYDNCCPHHCCLLDCLKKVVRCLDCLLPCHSCGSGCCGGGCGKAHFFHKGCCNSCDMGCTTGCSNYAPHGEPALSDPFQDDPTVPPAPPTPPTPMPDSQDARLRPHFKSPYASRGPAPMSVSRRMVNAPYKLSSNQPPVRPYLQVKALPPRTSRPVEPQDRVATQSEIIVQPAEKSVLRRASLEEEVYFHVGDDEATAIDAAPAPPALLPVMMEIEASDMDVPVNPLRR